MIYLMAFILGFVIGYARIKRRTSKPAYGEVKDIFKN